jgi:uncharacterized membrane protein YhaH (DUF805 family)
MKWYKKVVFDNYANFSGRARRSEYWYFFLFNIIFSCGFIMLDMAIGTGNPELGYGMFYAIYCLIMFIPGLAVTVRRLHDVGKSGWFYFIVLIPIIGVIWLLVLLFTDSQSGTNKWGNNPKSILKNNEKIEKSLTQKENKQTKIKEEILTKNKENMEGFKQCDKGHFYKDTLTECNYCPTTESTNSGDKTEILGANDPTSNPTEKTQVFGGATQQSLSSKESFDPERTIISGGNTSSAAGDTQDQITQKRKLRAWLVSFDIEDFGIDFKITEGKNTMGSKSSNDITIQDSQVSGLQGIILCKKDKFYLTDEVSSNGTLLNGEDLEPRKPYDIKDGDEIKVGNTNLLFKTAFKK